MNSIRQEMQTMREENREAMARMEQMILSLGGSLPAKKKKAEIIHVDFIEKRRGRGKYISEVGKVLKQVHHVHEVHG